MVKSVEKKQSNKKDLYYLKLLIMLTFSFMNAPVLKYFPQMIADYLFDMQNSIKSKYRFKSTQF